MSPLSHTHKQELGCFLQRRIRQVEEHSHASVLRRLKPAKETEVKTGHMNEKIYYLRIKERNQNLHKEFLIRLFAGVKLLHCRFCAIFKHTKVDSGVRAISDKSIIAKVLCDFLHLFQGNGRHCNWLSSSCGGDMGWGWGPARSIVTDCIRKILN